MGGVTYRAIFTGVTFHIWPKGCTFVGALELLTLFQWVFNDYLVPHTLAMIRLALNSQLILISCA